MPAPRKLNAAALTALSIATTAGATNIALPFSAAQPGYAGWVPFVVSELDSTTSGTTWIDGADTLSAGFGTPLTFSFVVGAGQAAQFDVVDAGFAGDTFRVFNGASLLGTTSAVPAGSFEAAIDIGLDHAGAFVDNRFSRAHFTLGSGSYRIGGELAQSVTLAGLPLNATAGAVRLTVANVSAVPEPSAAALISLGIALMAFALGRNRIR